MLMFFFIPEVVVVDSPVVVVDTIVVEGILVVNSGHVALLA